MTLNKSLFSCYTCGSPSTVGLGKSKTLQVAGKGTVKINIVVNGKRVKCMLNNVLHVPNLGYQLLSVPTFDKSLLYNERLCLTRYRYNDAEPKSTDVPSSTTENALVSQSDGVWHRRLEHVQPATILAMSNSQAVRRLHSNIIEKQSIAC